MNKYYYDKNYSKEDYKNYNNKKYKKVKNNLYIFDYSKDQNKNILIKNNTIESINKLNNLIKSLKKKKSNKSNFNKSMMIKSKTPNIINYRERDAINNFIKRSRVDNNRRFNTI